jgi:hypothetical protein
MPLAFVLSFADLIGGDITVNPFPRIAITGRELR